MTPRTTVGVCLMKSDEADAASLHLQERSQGIWVEDHVTYFRVETEEDLRIDLAEVAAYLGRDLSMSSFLVTLSAYFGKINVAESVLTVSRVGPDVTLP